MIDLDALAKSYESDEYKDRIKAMRRDVNAVYATLRVDPAKMMQVIGPGNGRDWYHAYATTR